MRREDLPALARFKVILGPVQNLNPDELLKMVRLFEFTQSVFCPIELISGPIYVKSDGEICRTHAEGLPVHEFTIDVWANKLFLLLLSKFMANVTLAHTGLSIVPSAVYEDCVTQLTKMSLDLIVDGEPCSDLVIVYVPQGIRKPHLEFLFLEIEEG